MVAVMQPAEDRLTRHGSHVLGLDGPRLWRILP